MRIRNYLAATVLGIALLVPCAALAGEWIPTQRPDCSVWNELPEANESAEWNGKCADGHASGYGELQWYKDGAPAQNYKGSLRSGKKNDYGVVTLENGDIFFGMFQNNMRTGRGILRRTDGSFDTGFWLKSRRVSDAEYSQWLQQKGAPWRVEDLRIAGLSVGNIMLYPFKTALGTPLVDVATRPQANIGRRLEYPGLVLGFIKLSRKDPLPLFILRGITVTSANYETERGIRVGDASDKVFAVYGQPMKEFTCPPEKYCRQTCSGDTCLLYYQSQTGLEWQDSEAEREKTGLGFGIKDGKIVEIHLGISAFL